MVWVLPPRHRIGIVLAVAVIAASFARCSEDDPVAMPDVVGKRLDTAKSDMERAGYDDDVEVLGGGVFGVVVESNWTVCSQEPASGEPITDAPRLTVDRSCESDDEEPEESESPEAEEEEPSESASPDGPEESEKPKKPVVLTVANSKEFAALLQKDYCSNAMAAFARKYRGRKIEFDGSISAIDAYDAGWPYGMVADIGVDPGDQGSNSSVGPFFQFEGVELEDPRPPGLANAALDKKFHSVAKVREFDPGSCIFRLAPIAARPR